MSKCCKCAKWFPHNWLCLKGLSIVFLVLFYVALVHAVFQAYAVFSYPAWPSKAEMWMAFTMYVLGDLAAAIGFLTLAKILKALRKIKNAVAPCCCAAEQAEKEEPAKDGITEVVEEESK